MSASHPVRRAGIAGVTVALLTSAALAAGLSAQPQIAQAGQTSPEDYAPDGAYTATLNGQDAGTSTTGPSPTGTASDAGTSTTESPTDTAGDPGTTTTTGTPSDAGTPDAADPAGGGTSAPEGTADSAGTPVSGTASPTTAPAASGDATPSTSTTAPNSSSGSVSTQPYAPETSPAEGAVTVSISGTYKDTQALLDRINAMRAEAAAEGITAPDGTPVSGAPLTLSTALEGAAQVRAVEASLSFSDARPNGLGTVFDTGNTFGIPISDELLGSDPGDDAATILEGWYAEKAAYLAYLETGVDTGDFYHYLALISDAYTHVGLGAFTADVPLPYRQATNTVVLVVELSSDVDDAAATAVVRPASGCIQQINVSASDYLTAEIAGETSVQEGASTQLTASVSSGAQLLADDTVSLVQGLNWASSDTSVATVDANGLVTAKGPGTATISYGTTTATLASVDLVVEAAPVTIVDVASPADITTEAGVAPTLPATLTATMSDGTTTDVPVTWTNIDARLYSNRGGGAFDVSGTVQGWDDTVSAHVIVNPATATDATISQTAVDVLVGETPALPRTATVTWSNGDTSEEAVTWDALDTSAYPDGGSVTLNGSVSSTGLTVSCTVNIAVPEPTLVDIPQLTGLSSQAATAALEDAGLVARVVTGDAAPSAQEEDTVYRVSPAAGTQVEEGSTVSLTAYGAYVAPTATSATTPRPITIFEGQAPELPATVQVTWSDGSTSSEDVSWETVDPARYDEPGTLTVHGTVSDTGLTVQQSVTVEAVTIASVDDPAPVTISAGTAPELPATISATMSDGSRQSLPVSWEAIDPSAYGAREGGSFTVAGTATDGHGTTAQVALAITVSPATITGAEAEDVTTQELVAPALPSTARVSWSNGDATDEAITWEDVPADAYAAPGTFEVAGTVAGGTQVSCTVTVTAATIVGQAEDVDVTTPSGTAPTLPQSVTMDYSNGTQRPCAVSWETPDPAAYAAREGGSFEATGTVEGWDGTVVAHVSVTPATMTRAAELAGVTTPAGTAPELPAQASVTWSNGDTTQEEISWEQIDPSAYLNGGTFTAQGSVDGGEADSLTVSCEVTVEDAYIAAVDTPEAITTPSGTAPALPQTLAAHLSNGVDEQVEVSWEAIDEQAYRIREGGTFTVSGTVEGWDEPVTLDVTVSPATITEIAQPAGLTIKEGATPTLSATVRVSWSNGDASEEAVSWGDPGKEAYAEPGSVTLSGTVEGWDEPVQLDITVEALVITAVEQPAAVSTEAGTAPTLPATVRVSWDNGTTTDEPVTWDAIDESLYHNGGSFTVSGRITSADKDEAVSVTVNVAGATVTAVQTVTLSTPAGIAPILPGTAQVSWSNGDVTDEAVSWPEVAADSYAAPGTFTVEGTFANAAISQAAHAEITVGAAVIASVDYVPDVSTVAGVAPTLPPTVMVTMSDGSRQSMPVTWDAIDPAQYRTRGTFVATGTVEGFEGQALITVKVASATVSSVQQQISVVTKAGVKPELPETVEFTWSDGSTTNERVTWDTVDESLYQHQGSFQVKGIASSWSVTATVRVEPSDGVPQTGDATMSVPALIGVAIAGVGAIAAAAVLLVRKKFRRS